MKKLYSLAIIAFSIIIATGCKKEFADNFKNPNQAEHIPPGLLFNGVLNDMFEAPFSSSERWNQYTAANYSYYSTNNYDWKGADFNFTTLKNVVKMEEEASLQGSQGAAPYLAMAKFFKAYFFIRMSLKVGDLPMTEALKGSANLKPKYDSQKTIFRQSLNWLEEANKEIAVLVKNGNSELKGDIYLKNNLLAWQKVINTFRLRTLIQLSKQVNDPDLQIKQQFAMILSAPDQYPVMTGMSDNLQYVYNENMNKYPNNKDNFGNDALRYNMAATYLNTLSDLQDPRAYAAAEPARGIAESKGYAITDYRNFVGASTGEDQGVMFDKVQKGLYSLINRARYYNGYTAENTFIISYPELCFTIAEAANRGWISTENAELWYKKGIQASISFYGFRDGDNTVTFLKKGGKLGDYETHTIKFDFENVYYVQPAVKYAGNTPEGLKQILTQKYLAFFRNSGFEAYYQYRRTQIPMFLTGPGVGNSERIPMRFQYPDLERTTNAENLSQALNAQYGGKDDINLSPWITK